MCAQLLGQVDTWLQEELSHGLADVTNIVEAGLNTTTVDRGITWAADTAESLACKKLLPTCAECCHVTTHTQSHHNVIPGRSLRDCVRLWGLFGD